VHGVRVLIPVGDLPQRRLLAITRPVTLALGADRIPAGFVLPVVIAAAQNQAVLGPDDLRPDGETGIHKALGKRPLTALGHGA
jgi:hypothetical protein